MIQRTCERPMPNEFVPNAANANSRAVEIVTTTVIEEPGSCSCSLSQRRESSRNCKEGTIAYIGHASPGPNDYLGSNPSRQTDRGIEPEVSKFLMHPRSYTSPLLLHYCASVFYTFLRSTGLIRSPEWGPIGASSNTGACAL